MYYVRYEKNLSLKQNINTWDGTEVSIKIPNELEDKENLFATFLSATNPELVRDSTKTASKILNANYEKVNLAKIIKG